ncbi:uncharacterized protein LOC121050487 [Rosa chinensis]|uniref:uncharacterized protein LOC121050487 n=1 Tax=Rosa chinensis TaxID=74649 RepID=UPI001AD8B385|nr:uncharacterized protein LOC121050487 [Rosa chinensis]
MGVYMADEDIVVLVLHGLPSELATIKTAIRIKTLSSSVSMKELRSLLLIAEDEIEHTVKSISERFRNEMMAHGDSFKRTCDINAADSSVSGKVECRETESYGIESRKINVDMQVMRGLSPGSDNMCEKVEHCVIENVLRQSSVGSKTRTSGSELLLGDYEASSNRTTEATKGCTIRKHINDCFDGRNGKDPVKVDRSITSDTVINRTYYATVSIPKKDSTYAANTIL